MDSKARVVPDWEQWRAKHGPHEQYRQMFCEKRFPEMPLDKCLALIQRHEDVRQGAGHDDANANEDTRGDWRVGQRVGNWYLRRRIDAGGFGEVWEAYHPHTDGSAAIKRFRPKRQLDPKMEAMFRDAFAQEGRCAGKLADLGAAVARVTDANPDEGYLVMQLYESDLSPELSITPLHPSEAARIAYEVARTLAQAHDIDIHHLDVKPGNILLDRRGSAYLTDFGLSATVRQVLEGAAPRGGTPAYRSPEQCEGRQLEIGPWCDVYSLGAVLFEMLTGERPPPADQRLWDEQEDSGRAVFLDKLRTAPIALRRICEKALALPAGKRYGNGRAIAASLKLAIRDVEQASGISSKQPGETLLAQVRQSMRRQVSLVTDEKLVKYIERVDAIEFPGECTQELVRWWRRFPLGICVLRLADLPSEPLGFVGLWPLTKNMFHGLTSGRKTEKDVHPRSICKLADGQQWQYWYAGDIWIAEELRKKRLMILRQLVAESLSLWLERGIFTDEIDVCALDFNANEAEVLPLFRAFGFALTMDHERSKVDWDKDVWTAKLCGQDIRDLTRSWSGGHAHRAPE